MNIEMEMDASAATSSCEIPDDDFYFESDHLALRGNADYRAVLRAIVVLESQKIEAGKHIDMLAASKKAALENPLDFVKHLSEGKKLDLPGPIIIENVSQIILRFCSQNQLICNVNVYESFSAAEN